MPIAVEFGPRNKDNNNQYVIDNPIEKNPCCPEGIGGIRRIWIMDRSFYEKVYVDSIGRILNILTRFPGKWHSFDVNPNSTLFSINQESDNQGIKYFHEVTGTIGILDAETRKAFESLRRRDIIVLVEDNNGNVWFLGENHPAWLDLVSGASGQSTQSENIYTFRIEEQNYYHARVVDDRYFEFVCVFDPNCNGLAIQKTFDCPCPTYVYGSIDFQEDYLSTPGNALGLLQLYSTFQPAPPCGASIYTFSSTNPLENLEGYVEILRLLFSDIGDFFIRLTPQGFWNLSFRVDLEKVAAIDGVDFDIIKGVCNNGDLFYHLCGREHCTVGEVAEWSFDLNSIDGASEAGARIGLPKILDYPDAFSNLPSPFTPWNVLNATPTANVIAYAAFLQNWFNANFGVGVVTVVPFGTTITINFLDRVAIAATLGVPEADLPLYLCSNYIITGSNWPGQSGDQIPLQYISYFNPPFTFDNSVGKGLCCPAGQSTSILTDNEVLLDPNIGGEDLLVSGQQIANAKCCECCENGNSELTELVITFDPSLIGSTTDVLFRIVDNFSPLETTPFTYGGADINEFTQLFADDLLLNSPLWLEDVQVAANSMTLTLDLNEIAFQLGQYADVLKNRCLVYGWANRFELENSLGQIGNTQITWGNEILSDSDYWGGDECCIESGLCDPSTTTVRGIFSDFSQGTDITIPIIKNSNVIATSITLNSLSSVDNFNTYKNFILNTLDFISGVSWDSVSEEIIYTFDLQSISEFLNVSFDDISNACFNYELEFIVYVNGNPTEQTGFCCSEEVDSGCCRCTNQKIYFYIREVLNYVRRYYIENRLFPTEENIDSNVKPPECVIGVEGVLQFVGGFFIRAVQYQEDCNFAYAGAIVFEENNNILSSKDVIYRTTQNEIIAPYASYNLNFILPEDTVLVNVDTQPENFQTLCKDCNQNNGAGCSDYLYDALNLYLNTYNNTDLFGFCI